MAVGWIPLLALAATGAVGRRLHRCPGGVGFAFGGEYAAARRDLDPAAQAFQRDRPRLIRESEAEPRRVRIHTTGRVEAGLRLDAIAAGQGDDPRVPGALQDLDAAHARRYALTGHRPR